jgi:long-subunit fatty acid transport protein
MRNNSLRLAMNGLILFAGVVASSTVLAQDRPPTDLVGATGINGIPIDLLPPGARALGLAGAFGAVADDATAAVANPAGLTILSASEFSIHFRDSDFDIDFVDIDAYNSGLFSSAGDLNKRYTDSGSDVSFASFVKPFDRFTISAFYLNQVTLDAVAAPESVVDSVFNDTYTNLNEIAAQVEGFGVGFGFRFSDSWSIGMSVQRVELEVRSFDFWGVEDFFDGEFFLSNLSCDPNVGGALGVPCDTPGTYAPVLDDFRGFGTEVDGDDTDVTITAGLLFSPSSKWSFGLVYREGGEFDFGPNNVAVSQFGCTGSGTQTDFCLNFFPATSGSTVTSPIPSDPNNPASAPLITTIGIPDTLTFGIAFRPTDTFLISLDINDVSYSDLPQVRPRTLGFNLDVNDAGFRQGMNDPGVAGAGPITERIEDETTIHLGLEKVFPLSGDFLSMYTLTIRGGAFTDKDHDGNALLDSDETHGVFGLGATFGDHVQVDLAAEFSDRVDNLVFSAIYRF